MHKHAVVLSPQMPKQIKKSQCTTHLPYPLFFAERMYTNVGRQLMPAFEKADDLNFFTMCRKALEPLMKKTQDIVLRIYLLCKD